MTNLITNLDLVLMLTKEEALGVIAKILEKISDSVKCLRSQMTLSNSWFTRGYWTKEKWLGRGKNSNLIKIN